MTTRLFEFFGSTLALAIMLSTASALAQSEVDLKIERSVHDSFKTKPGKKYQAALSKDLKQWVALGAPVQGTGDTVSFFYNTTDDQKVFFKVTEQDAIVEPGGDADLSGRVKVIEGQLAQLDIRRSFLASLGRHSIIRKDLSGFDMNLLDLSRWAFLDTILSNADFSNAVLDRIEITDAIITGAYFSNADLRGARIHRTVLKNSNFRGANMTGVELGSVDLSGADLTGAIGFNPDQQDITFRDTTMPDGTIRTD